MKRFISGMLVLAMLFSLAQPLSAAEPSAPEKLNKLGLISGTSEQELRSSLTRDVGITMILKAIGYTQADADAVADNGQFVDVKGWAKGWAELAYIEGITSGVGRHHFDPRGLMSERQFVAFLLRALEYDKDAAWSSVVALGHQSGIVGSGNSLLGQRLSKSDGATYMYNALKATLQKKDRVLINDLIGKGLVSVPEAEAQGLIPDAFKITGQIHNNYKEIFLTFSKAINQGTLTGDTFKVLHNGKALNFDPNPYNGTGSSAYAVEFINDEAVRIYLGTNLNEKDEIRVAINGLISEAGDTMIQVLTMKPRDTASPKVEKVEALGRKQIRFTMSEPVQLRTNDIVHSNILIDDKVARGDLSLNYDRTEVTLKLREPMTDSSYAIEVDGFEDFANVLSKVYIGRFDVADDTQSPLLKSAELTDSRHMTLIFDQRIGREEGTIEVAGHAYKLSEARIKEEKVLLNLEKPFALSSDKTILAKGVKDEVGNATEVSEAKVTVPVDITAPTMLVRGIDTDELLLIFSEPVQNVDRNHIYVRTGKDAVLSIASLNRSGEKDGVYRVELAGAMSGNSSYYVSAKGIKDLSPYENVMPTADVNVGLSDTKQPTVKAVNLLADGKVRVTYSEAMNGTYVANPAFYRFQDASLGTSRGMEEIPGATLRQGTDDTYVDIAIPGMESADKISVLKVRDRTGNILSGYGTLHALKAADAFDASDISVQLVDNQTLRLTAQGHTFADVARSDFKFITEGGQDGLLYAHSVAIGDSKNMVDITLNTKMKDDATYLESPQYMYVSGTGTADTFGAILQIPQSKALKVMDKVRPVITVEEGGGQIRLKFSELVKAGGNSEVMSDITLRDSQGKAVNLMPGISLFYVGGEDFSYRGFTELVIDGIDRGTYTLTVHQQYIRDMSGNKNRGYNTTSVSVN